MCLESRDRFKFWAISDNISLMVQDSEQKIVCGLSNETIANALE